jgi:hypothetical protein
MLQAQITDGDLVSYPHCFLFYYITRHEYGPDWYSWSLINFKNDKRNDVAAWSDYATVALKDLNLNENTVLIRALHSHETAVTPNA